MSFIGRRNERLFEKSTALRRELAAFLFLVTFWALGVSLFSSLVYALFEDKFQWWAKHDRALAAAVLTVIALMMAWGALVALASGVMSSFGEVRRFHVVLPVATSGSGVRVLPVRGYHVTKGIAGQLQQHDRAAVAAACREALEKYPGRPFTGEFFDFLAGAVTNELVVSLKRSCGFLLSANAEFHGFDYSCLSAPPGPCAEVEVEGMPGKKIHLPSGFGVRIEPSGPDRYGKRTRGVAIHGPTGKIAFSVWPQWAILSKGPGGYNSRSFAFAEARIGEPGAGAKLWMLKLPVEMRVTLSAGWRPHLFLSRRFEVFASWICELLDRTETFWSWEAFVDRTDGEPEAAEDGSAGSDG